MGELGDIVGEILGGLCLALMLAVIGGIDVLEPDIRDPGLTISFLR